MKLKIVNRKYCLGGKWFRFQKMKGTKYLGFKIAIIRFYDLNQKT